MYLPFDARPNKEGFMSQDEITVDLEKREVIGKGLNALRREGSVPAVIHNHGKDSLHVMGDGMALVKVYKQAGKHHAVQLKLDGKEHLAIIKDVDFEPKKNRLRHIVFQAIKQNEKIQTEVPVVLEGEIPAVKSGLMVITNVTTVEVEAFPKDLPDQITVDATKLAEIGDKIHVSDLTLPSGVTIITEAETTVAVVEETKAQMSEEAEEAESSAEGAATAEAGNEETKE
jgi:large subunit ribosomal protein L25